MAQSKKKEINVEKTIESILNHKIQFADVDESRLREEAEKKPSFLLGIAKLLRVDVIYK